VAVEDQAPDDPRVHGEEHVDRPCDRQDVDGDHGEDQGSIHAVAERRLFHVT